MPGALIPWLMSLYTAQLAGFPAKCVRHLSLNARMPSSVKGNSRAGSKLISLTILMDRADKFGLAQLHQLRGRVGRSHHQAYAYLMTPHPKAMSRDAKKRLEAITSLEDLGAGFTLATHDLEIRGAGDLLGEEQSGHIEAIGFSLYMETLDRAVNALKEGKTPDVDFALHQGAEIEIKIPALIPENYVADVNTRLILYKRLANAADHHSLEELQVEFIDRFGKLPTPTQHLFAITTLKLQAGPLGITKIEANAKGGRLHFGHKTNINPKIIVQLIQQENHLYQMDGPERLRFKIQSEGPKERVQVIKTLLAKLQST